MEYLLIGIIIILVILLLLKKEKAPDEEKFPYQYRKRTYSFSKNELNFYRNLTKEATNLNFIPFSKMRLTDIIESKEKDSTWQSQFNRICSKHVSFALCGLPSIRPMLIIELDNSNHDKADRRDRDSFVGKALTRADIPIIHTRSSSGIGERIKAVISKQKRAVLPHYL